MKRGRMYASTGLLAAVIAAIGFIPFPSHVYCPLEVEARDAEPVYVWVNGVLDDVYVKPGDKVVAGQPLAKLSNIDIDLAITELQGEQAVHEAELDGLQRVSFEDRTASSRINSVNEALASVKKKLVQREDDRAKLQLVAPRDGTVLPPPRVEQRGDGVKQLPTWSGTPFDRHNLGATLAPGTKLCQIGEPNRLQARLIIDQGDAWFVRVDQPVEIMLDQSADYVYRSYIADRGGEVVKESPSHLSSLHNGPLPTQMGNDGVARPLSPVIDALVPLPEDDPHGLLRIGLVGRAKISTPPRTLWQRLYRYITRTFNFEL